MQRQRQPRLCGVPRRLSVHGAMRLSLRRSGQLRSLCNLLMAGFFLKPAAAGMYDGMAMNVSGVMVEIGNVSKLQEAQAYCVCCELPASPEPVLIGTPFDLHPTSYSRWGRRSMDMFFKWVNGVRGGICVGGERRPAQIRLLHANDYETLLLPNASQQLLSEGVQLFLAPSKSSNTVPVAQAVDQARDCVMMAPWSAVTSVFEDRRNVFGTLLPTDLYLKAGLDLLKNLPSGSAKNVAFIEQAKPGRVRDTFLQALCLAAKELTLENQLEIVRSGSSYNYLIPEDFDDAQTIEALRPLRSQTPDVLIICGRHIPQCDKIISGLKSLDINSKFIAMSLCLAESNKYMDTLGDDGRFIVGSVPWLSSLDIKSDFAPRWTPSRLEQALGLGYLEPEAEVQSPYHAGSVWASAALIVDAVEDENSTDGQLAAEHFRRVRLNTTYGKISFDRNGQNNAPMNIIQFQGNESADADTSPAWLAPAPSARDELFFPIPPWRERNCYMKRSWRPDGYSESSVWGFTSINKEHFVQKFKNEELLKGSAGPEYDFDEEVGRAVVFMAMIGMRNYQELDYAYQEVHRIRDFGNATKGDVNEARAWIRSLVDAIIVDMDDVNLAAEAAAAFFLAPDREAPVCAPCPFDKVAVYDTQSQNRACVPCPPFFRSDLTINKSKAEAGLVYMSRECTKRLCPPGEKLLADGNCSKCPAGRYGTVDNTACLPCDIGTFASDPGSTECRHCGRGEFGNVSESTTCHPCPMGRASSFEGESECPVCTRGTYANSTNRTDCEFCPLGKVATGEEAKECQDCPPGKYSVRDATACLPCAAGTYQPQQGMPGCKDFPEGAVNLGEGAQNLTNTETYWYMFQEPYDMSLLRCNHFAHACLEGQKCVEGSTGELCLSCIPGYARTHQIDGDNPCFKCPSFNLNVAVHGVFVALVIVFSFFVTRFALVSDKRPQDLQVIFFKELVLHCVITNVLCIILGEVIAARWRALGEGTTSVILTLCHALMYISGSQLIDFRYFSVTCLAQEFSLPPQWEQLATTLDGLLHGQWYLPDNAGPRDLLADMMRDTEFLLVIGWAAFPIVVMVLIYVLGFLFLGLTLTWHRSSWKRALKFYDDLIDKGVKEAIEIVEKSRDHEWTLYVREHSHYLFQIWWLVPHADINRRGMCLNLGLFVQETSPIVLVSFVLMYSGVLAGTMRPWHCKSHKGSDGWGDLYMYYSGALECEFDDLGWLSIGISAFWGVVIPFVLLAIAGVKRSAMENSVETRKVFNILINGYSEDCWWWETVSFLMKGAFIVVLCLPFAAETKNTMCLIGTICYGAAFLHFEPFDIRCNRVLIKMHGLNIATCIIHCVGVDFLSLYDAKQTETNLWWSFSALGIVAVVFVAHALVLALLAHRIYRCLLDSYVSTFDWQRYEKDLAEGRSSRSCVVALQAFFLAKYEEYRKEAPYVCLDPLFGWAVLCGSGGDVAEPPKIPRGRGIPGGRPALSAVECQPPSTEVIEATEYHKERLQRMLTAAAESIAMRVNNPTMSVSLIEFTIRAGMTLARSKQILLSDHVQHVFWSDYEDVVDMACAELDFLDSMNAFSDDADIGPANELKKGETVLVDCDGKSREATIIKGLNDLVVNVRYLDDRTVERNVHHNRVRLKETTHKKAVTKSAVAAKGHFVPTHDNLQEHPHIISAFGLSARTVRDQEISRRNLGGADTEFQDVLESGPDGLRRTLGSQGSSGSVASGEGAARPRSRSMSSAGSSSSDDVGLGAVDAERGSGDAGRGAVGSGQTGAETGRASAAPAPGRGTTATFLGSMKGSTQGFVNNKSARAARRRMDRHIKMERKLAAAVQNMFHPVVFSRGVDLESLQLALMELVRLPRPELELWMDLFEDTWVTHNKFEAHRLNRYSGDVCDVVQQTDLKEQRPIVGGALWSKSDILLGMEDPEVEQATRTAKFEEMFYPRFGDQSETLSEGGAAVEDLTRMTSMVGQDDSLIENFLRHKEVQVGYASTAVAYGGGATSSSAVAASDPGKQPDIKQQEKWGNTWVQDRDPQLEAALNWIRFVLKAGGGLSEGRMDLRAVTPLIRTRRDKMHVESLQQDLEAEAKLREEEERQEREANEKMEQLKNKVSGRQSSRELAGLDDGQPFSSRRLSGMFMEGFGTNSQY